MAVAAHARFDQQLQSSIDYLSSDAAMRSFEVDTYWPKWDSPWWHMTLMWELGAADRIPRSALKRWTADLNTRYLQFFPFREEEVPAGVDPISGVMCHCGLGTAYQVLKAAGVSVDAELPWVRKWICTYQMEEGGWNCDESAYIKATPKSSIVSSVPMLEALLTIPDRTAEENAVLDRGARYLIERRLFRSLRTGQVINQDWLMLTFPRFYEYDILRGLNLLARWSVERKQALDKQSILEAIEIIENKVITSGGSSGLPVERQFHATCGSRLKSADGTWTKGPSSDFPLLRWCSQVGRISPSLTAHWNCIGNSLS